MDAYLTDVQRPEQRFEQPPVLIARDSEAALDRAARTVAASGLRIVDRVRLESASERIDRQVSASALWVELDADRGAPMDRLLDHVNRDSRDGRYAAVIAAPGELLDAIEARLTDGSVESWSTATRRREPRRWRWRLPKAGARRACRTSLRTATRPGFGS